MGMVKIVDPRGWDWDRPVALMVKVSSRGLIGDDRAEFIKVASPMFLPMIDNLKLAKDDVPVHQIALGASEAYGPNRNGDGFKEAECRAHHDRFVKYARWYRNHKNKDPKQSYGHFKASAYNDEMRRVELLGILNGSKEAAERNGGLVADKELEKLAKGEDIPGSMACRVAHDVCSNCLNKAATRADYCTEDTCVGTNGEKRGGCKHNLTKVGSDGHVLHVDNPDPYWFDYSNVFRPADRIAYGGGADYLQKAASHEFVHGAEMADALGVTAPMNVIVDQTVAGNHDPLIEGQLKLACALARLEHGGTGQAKDVLRAFTPTVQTSANWDINGTMGTPGSEKSAQALGALAERKVLLPLRDFARWIGKEAAVDKAAQILPGSFTRLLGCEDLAGRLASNPFATSAKTASLRQRGLANLLFWPCSLDKGAVQERMMKSAMHDSNPPSTVKTAGSVFLPQVNADEIALADAYSLYKLAALHHLAASDQTFDLTCRFAISQNMVII
jgi:hypothetical protein